MVSKDCSHITGYVDPKWPRPDGNGSACIIIFGYVPSLTLGILGVLLFALALGMHLRLLFRYQTWYFSTMIVGTVMEIIGYIFRILASKINPYSVSYFVGQYFCIVVAPVFYSAAIYSILSVMINWVGQKHSQLPPRLLLWIFITCDVVATIIQVLGAGLVGSRYSNGGDPNVPNKILLAGLAFQTIAFTVFIFCYSTFFYSSRKIFPTFLRSFAAATLVAAILVYIRTIIRLAETAQGLLHFLSTHEAIFGSLEFAPIIIAVYIFIFFHPGMYKSGL
ncbi:RTA1-domain-containing protein [Viridothelium virens]|uniref:RTA1-domain-containing protein n=1 Tax=Viridothelium virens TaxID=1048519 RepID=A0A6A6H7F9_VIRVR|nr:RTA1-domain-containing protein [Viridothelium virens]